MAVNLPTYSCVFAGNNSNLCVKNVTGSSLSNQPGLVAHAGETRVGRGNLLGGNAVVLGLEHGRSYGVSGATGLFGTRLGVREPEHPLGDHLVHRTGLRRQAQHGGACFVSEFRVVADPLCIAVLLIGQVHVVVHPFAFYIVGIAHVRGRTFRIALAHRVLSNGSCVSVLAGHLVGRGGGDIDSGPSSLIDNNSLLYLNLSPECF